MKTHFSNTEYAKKVAALQQQSMHVCPPAITFSRKKQDKDKEEDKDKYHKIDVPINPAEPDQTTERRILTFEDGTAEEWIKWRIAFDNLAEEHPLATADKKLRLLRTLLRGEAKDNFETAYSDSSNTGLGEVKIQRAINEMAKAYFNNDPNAWRRQRNYMRFHLSDVQLVSFFDCWKNEAQPNPAIPNLDLHTRFQADLVLLLC